MPQITYRIQAFFLALLFRAFRLLALDISSAIGAMIGRAIGPFFKAHHTAKKNLAAAFPDKKPHERQKILNAMWAHLGRVGAEYSSLSGQRLTSRITVHGAEYLPKKGEAALFFSGHIGNWELLSPVAFDRGVDLSIVYRHTNNPFVDRMIADIRQHHASELIVKSLRGGIKILSALKRGGSVAMLVDQKLNNGISVPFFGREAMTSPAIAEIALKYNIPIIPARVIRTHGAYFEGHIYPPLNIHKSGDHKADVLAVMIQINAILEAWIREHPEQWFWVHKRWPKTSQ